MNGGFYASPIYTGIQISYASGHMLIVGNFLHLLTTVSLLRGCEHIMYLFNAGQYILLFRLYMKAFVGHFQYDKEELVDTFLV